MKMRSACVVNVLGLMLPGGTTSVQWSVLLAAQPAEVGAEESRIGTGRISRRGTIKRANRIRLPANFLSDFDSYFI
jgi:hypothetical protein